MLVCAVVLAVTARAGAAPAAESIVVASDDVAFRAALADALEPAGIAIVSRDGVAAPALGAIASASRALADEAHATATVWLVAAPEQATLVTYDRGVDRVLVRALPFGAPLTPAQAAESARMARTMLRALRVTPDSDLPPPHASDAPAVRAAVPGPMPPRAADRFATSFAMGMRMRGPGDSLVLAAEAGVAWRPAALGVALVGAYAPGSDVMASGFSGTVHDDSLALLARQPLRWGPRTELVVLAGAALHDVRVRGTLAAGSGTEATSFDASLRAGVIAAYALDPTVKIGVQVSADCLLERQRYIVDSEQVLEIPRLQLTAGAVLVLRVL